MDVDRREWLVRGAQFTGIGALVAGIGCFRHAEAKRQFRQDLSERARPVLTEKRDQELAKLPARACDEIREYMHGVCLHVHDFVDRITSNEFRERLGAASSDQQREALLTLEFEQRVVRETEILSRLDVIAREIGQDLDSNWETCCRQISETWSACSLPPGRSIVPHELTAQVDSTVRLYLQQAQRQADLDRDRATLDETVRSVGSSALMLYSMTPIVARHSKLFPLFLIAALVLNWKPIIELLADPRPELKQAISLQLSQLGNQAGDEFETVVRRLIEQLQEWQEAAIFAEIERCTAQEYSNLWG